MRSHINCPNCKGKLTDLHGIYGTVREDQGFPVASRGEIFRCRKCSKHWMLLRLPPDFPPTLHAYDVKEHRASVAASATLPDDWTGLPRVIEVPFDVILDLSTSNLAAIRADVEDEIRRFIDDGDEVFVLDQNDQRYGVVRSLEAGLRVYVLPSYRS